MWRYVVPNALSCGNLAMGMVAMACALEENYFAAAVAILAGMVFDALDGNMARLLHAGSEFGKQMDALCDLVTFGAAPAFLLYHQLLSHSDLSVAWLPILAFPCCGALRLARFNTTVAPQGGGFCGMPITAAGGILAVCSLSIDWFGVMGILLFTALLSFLMVSTIRYPDIKSVPFLKKPVGIAVALIAVLGCIWLFRDWLFVPLVAYACCGPLLMLITLKS